MQCPKCSDTDTRVIDSRTSKDGYSIRRRRECQNCNHRFTTVEEIVREGLIVRKRNGIKEPFDKQKILNGLRRACEKRPIDPEQIKMMLADILFDFDKRFDQELPSSEIGEAIMQKLKEIDHIAYVRFASVYKDFRDIEEFQREITGLKENE